MTGSLCLKSEHGWLDGDRPDIFCRTGSQSHKGINLNHIVFVAWSNHEESTHDVDISQDNVESPSGEDGFLVDQSSLVQIIPVVFPHVLVNSCGFGIDLCLGDFLSTFSFDLNSSAGDLEVSVLVHLDQEFSNWQSEGDDEGVNINRAVGSLNILGISITQSNEGINLGFLGFFGPWGNHEEGADNISVDEEVNESFGGIDIGLIKEVSLSQVIPINSPHFLVNCGDNVGNLGLFCRISVCIIVTVLAPTRFLIRVCLSVNEPQQSESEEKQKCFFHLTNYILIRFSSALK